MRLYTIKLRETEYVAVQREDRLYRLCDMGLGFKDMNELICAGEKALKKVREFDGYENILSISLQKPHICSPIENPLQDILCIGVNYDDHIKETAALESFQNNKATVYFSKRANFISGAADNIPDYDYVKKLDYEVELAVIINRDLRNYRRGRDADPVFGYSVFNDVSARDLQFRHGQWFMGKSLDGYSIMGPCIVTPDEVGDVQSLDVECRVNGEVRQHSNTSFMITPVYDAIEELSSLMTLRAGTVIATGTPGGVAMGMKEPVYLKKGDVVECEIEKLGKIVNTVG